MAVGAYSMYLMVVYLQFNFWLSLPIAMLISGISGLVFGIPSLRIKGFYLAMATLAAQFIIPWMIVNIRPDLTGGVETVTFPSPRIGDFVFNTQENIFYLVFVFAILAIYFARNIQRSRIGRAFVAIRDNDLAAEIMGISIFRYKLLSFFICSIYAGLAGVLLAVWIRGVSYELFGLHESIWFLGMLILGGLGSVPGVCFGVLAIRGLEILVRYSGGIIRPLFNPEIGRAIELGIAPIVFGVVVLSFIIFEPKGLAQIWERIKNFYRSWPFSY
jgi:branched-chain amino acid transport system permease protein